MSTLIGFKRVFFAAVAAMGFAAHGAWVVDTTAKTLVDEESGWGFTITIANTTNITLTAITSGEGDLDLRGLPDGYRLAGFGTIFKGSTTLASFICEPTLEPMTTTAFYNCSALTNWVGGLAPGKDLDEGHKDMFWNSKKLASLTLTGVKYLPNYFCESCSGLKDAYLPDVTSINGSFSGCSALTNLVCNWAEMTQITGGFPTGMGGDLYLPKATTVGGFSGSKITSINVPKVKKLLGSAFNSCTSLTNFFGGLELETLESKDVFWNCPKLTGAITWPKLKVIHGNTFDSTKVQSIDLSSLETFSTAEANSKWLPISATNVILGPVTAMPNGVLQNNSPAVPQQVHFLGPAVPTFAGKAFDNPDSKICRFFIHNREAIAGWTDACLQLKSQGGDYGKYFYNAQGKRVCPNRTIGIVNATGHDPNGWGYAYAINATASGMSLLVR